MSEHIQQSNMSGREYAAMQALFSLRAAFDTTSPVLERRAGMIGKAEELKQLRDMAKDLMDAMVQSVPEPKRTHMILNLSNTRVYIKVEAPGLPTKESGSNVIVPSGALDYVLNAMIDNYCVLCDKSEIEGRHCPHRTAMESCLPHAIKVDRGSERCMFADLALGFDELADN